MRRTREHNADLIGLLNGAQAGSNQALEDLLTRLHVAVLSFVRRRFDDQRDAEAFAQDVASEALIRVAEGYRSCQATTDRQLMAWTLTIARNVGLDIVRSRLVRVGALVALPHDDPRNEIPSPANRRDERSPAEDLLFHIMQEAHDRLPDSAQDLLWIRFVEGAEWAEVGSELGISSSSAKRRWQRMQARLRREILAGIHDLPKPERDRVLAHLAATGFDAI